MKVFDDLFLEGVCIPTFLNFRRDKEHNVISLPKVCLKRLFGCSIVVFIFSKMVYQIRLFVFLRDFVLIELFNELILFL